MKKAKRFLAVILAVIMAFSCTAIFASAAAIPKSLKIVKLPDRTTFYKGTDWDYGYFTLPEDELGEFVPGGNEIAFMHNGGYDSRYPDMGMLDMTGLVVEVKYSDGTTSNVTYKETKSGIFVGQNICVSPATKYKAGKNVVEIYFTSNIDAYTTYEINLVDKIMGDVNFDTYVNSTDALLVLQHIVGMIKLTAKQLAVADMNSDSKINSTDALLMLQKAVGK